MTIVIRQADMSLDIIIVGGGISGLAAAYMLSKAGHQVRVFESHDLDARGGGHRVPPNLSKILQQWFGAEKLMRVSTPCVGTPLHRMQTGEKVGCIPWKPAVLAETGGDFLLMHHEDLIHLLYSLAVDAGATIHLKSSISSIKQGTKDDLRPSVTLRNGDHIRADILIGADGYHSTVRNVLVEEAGEEQPFQLTRPCMTVSSGTVHADDIRVNPEVMALMTADEFPVWMGDNTSLCGHPMRKRQEFCIGLYSWITVEPSTGAPRNSGDRICSSEETIRPDQCATVQRLLRAARHLYRMDFHQPSATPNDWVDSSGRIVLIGEAAHPSLPGGSHTASMAVEDAVVLGCLLSHLRTLEQLPTFLNAYQELRQGRCAMARSADIANTRLMCLPPGPEANARDESARRQMDSWDEGMVKAQFEEIAEIFGYDAGDAAEEWWIDWGRFHDGSVENTVLDLGASHVSVLLHDE